MKKKSTSKSAFFNLRVLTGLFVVLAGVFLTLVGFSTLSKAFAQAKPQQKERDAIHEDPAARMAWERLRLQDENGRISRDALRQAYDYKKTMPFRPEAWAEFLPKNSTNEPEAVQSIWTSIGPGNIGGRTRSIIIHPTNPATIWLGAVGGGVWKTTNGGTSWSTTTDFLANLAVDCMAIDPRDPNVLYAGTGEPGPYDGIRGDGIFKTTNGGTTWTQLSSTANNPDFYEVTRLAANPRLRGVLLATTTSGIFRSVNGGANWSRVKTGTWNTVVFSPNDSNKCIASAETIYYSTDGGLTWTPSGTAGAWKVELAYAPSNPNIVYASTGVDGVLYRSTNGGQSFVRTGASHTVGSQGWYDNTLWVDPTNPDILVVGGVSLWRSTDGGNTVTEIATNSHPDHHVTINHPEYNGSNNKTVFIGTDGGIYRTDDILAPNVDWDSLNHSLGITQFYGGAANSIGSTIIGGTQDNGTLRYRSQDGPENWMSMEGGDGGFCAAGGSYFYGEQPILVVYRSSDGSHANLQYIANNLGDAGFDGKGNWAAPIVLDPNNSNRLLAGGLSLWRSNNANTPNPQDVTWTAIKSSIGSSFSANISAVAVAEGNSDVIWVGHNGNSGVYFTTNGTATTPTWTKVGTGNLPNRMCERIAIDPPRFGEQFARVYVTFGGLAGQGGFNANNVWKTENNGQTWTNISNGLPSVPVHSIVISPLKNLYIGTHVGVFASADGGGTWSPGVNGDVPANVVVDELFWTNGSRRLVAVTHGRGMFTADVQ